MEMKERGWRVSGILRVVGKLKLKQRTLTLNAEERSRTAKGENIISGNRSVRDVISLGKRWWTCECHGFLCPKSPNMAERNPKGALLSALLFPARNPTTAFLFMEIHHMAEIMKVFLGGTLKYLQLYLVFQPRNLSSVEQTIFLKADFLSLPQEFVNYC